MRFGNKLIAGCFCLRPSTAYKVFSIRNDHTGIKKETLTKDAYKVQHDQKFTCIN